MEHVWNVIDGDIYVSKNGDDVAGDGSMANPYASINKATDVGADGNKIVIGTGIWQEARGTSSNAYNYYGDGLVVFDGSGTAWFTFQNTELGDNITLQNYSENRNMYTTTLTFGDVVNCWNLNNCKVYNIRAQCGTYGAVFLNSKNTLFYGYGGITQWGYGFELYVENCIFSNWDYTPNTIKRGAIFHKIINCIFYENDSFPAYMFSTTPIVEKNLSYGTYIAPYGEASPDDDSIDAVNLNPKFNNAEIGDYTLQSDSPCLFAGKNNATIGAFGLGYSFDANSSEFTEEGGAVFSQTTLVNDIIRTSQVINGITCFLFQFAAGHPSGNIESAWIDLQAIRYLLITRIFANFIYNTSGVATSRPDNLETAGEKTVYYDFELKYCNEESEKDTATFKNVIWNKAVTIDDSDRGNANPDFVASEAKYISARFIKIKLYMTEA